MKIKFTLKILVSIILVILVSYQVLSYQNKPLYTSEIRINEILFTSKGRYLYVTTNKGIYVWNSKTGQKIFSKNSESPDEMCSIDDSEDKIAYTFSEQQFIDIHFNIFSISASENLFKKPLTWNYIGKCYFEFCRNNGNNIIYANKILNPEKRGINAKALYNCPGPGSFRNNMYGIFRLNDDVLGTSLIRQKKIEESGKYILIFELIGGESYNVLKKVELKLSLKSSSFNEAWKRRFIHIGGTKVFVLDFNDKNHIYILDINNSKIRHYYDKGSPHVFSVSYSGKYFATKSSVKTIDVYNSEDGKSIYTIDLDKSLHYNLVKIAFDENNMLLAIVYFSDDRYQHDKILIYDIQKRKVVKHLYY